jgi:hypothetical protein
MVNNFVNNIDFIPYEAHSVNFDFVNAFVIEFKYLNLNGEMLYAVVFG